MKRYVYVVTPTGIQGFLIPEQHQRFTRAFHDGVRHAHSGTPHLFTTEVAEEARAYQAGLRAERDPNHVVSCDNISTTVVLGGS